MSKQLEKEYRSLMKEDAPDLWGRIEAGLEPKKQPVQKMGFWRKYRTWGTVVAACVCLMVAVPVMQRLTGRGPSNMSDSTTSAGENMSGAPYDGVSSDAALWDADENMSNEAAENTAGEMLDGEQEAAGCTMTAKVLELSESENRTAYTVQIEETDSGELSNGEQIILYDERMSDVRLEEGRTYRLRITVRTDGDGTEYLLEEIIF
ncbi:MAG: hypothetical protein HDQ95_04475 [Roseburia sp.]|nr:hypothetical protein [Roseburia sp.]